MKVYKFIPILAVAMLIPSFAEARHSDRGQRRQYTERGHDHYPLNWATFGHRTGHDRGYNHTTTYGHRQYGHRQYGHRQYGHHQYGHHDDHYYCDHRSHDRYGHSRHGSHRRSRRGIHFGGVIVIRF